MCIPDRCILGCVCQAFLPPSTSHDIATCLVYQELTHNCPINTKPLIATLKRDICEFLSLIYSFWSADCKYLDRPCQAVDLEEGTDLTHPYHPLWLILPNCWPGGGYRPYTPYLPPWVILPSCWPGGGYRIYTPLPSPMGNIAKMLAWRRVQTLHTPTIPYG